MNASGVIKNQDLFVVFWKMNTLIFGLLCLLQCLCEVVSLNLLIKKDKVYSKTNANAELLYTIELSSSESINDVIITLGTAKGDSSSFIDLVIIEFENGQPLYTYKKFNATKFIHNRINVEFKSLQVTLTIRDIKTEDFDRKYSCSLELAINQVTKSVVLKKATPPTIATSNIFLDNNTVTVKLGKKNAKYLCEADGLPMPTITWDRVNHLGEFQSFKGRGLGSAFLEFPTFNREDRGGYRCTATNEGGSVFKTFFIFPGYIEYEKDKLEEETVSLHMDETYHTACPIRGHPALTYAWNIDNGNKTLVSLTKTFVYTIRNVEDYVGYTCTASNTYGKLQYTVIFKNAAPVTPTVEGVNKSNQTNSSTMKTQSAILVTLLHLASSMVVFIL